MKKTILITGRNGFIGNEVALALRKTFNILSIIKRKRQSIDYSGEDIILSDVNNLGKNDLKINIDLILHMAASVRGMPNNIYKNNLNSTKIITDIARELMCPLIFISSINSIFHKELGAYSRSKKQSEEYIINSGVKYLILRPSLVMGRNSNSIKTIRRVYGRYLFFPLFGNQAGKVAPIHVSTLVEIINEKVNNWEFTNEIINICGRINYEYHDIIRNIINSNINVKFIKLPFRLSIIISKIFEIFHLPFVVSSEEIISTNIDKILYSKNISYSENRMEFLLK